MQDIEVKQSHIDAGRPRLCFCCPLALAIQAVCLASAEVSVSFGVAIRVGGRVWMCDLPEFEWRLLGEFDHGRGMRPHVLALPKPIPAWALREPEAA